MSRTRTRTRRLRPSTGAIAGLVACAVLVAACGAGTKGSTSTGNTGGSTTTCVPSTTAAGSVAGTTLAPAVTKRKGVVHEFVIPPGTSERVKKTGDPGIIPKHLEVHVGDKIRVRNDDSEIARLGIFDVGPGETVTMSFNKPGPQTGVIFGDQTTGCGSPPPKEKAFTIQVLP